MTTAAPASARDPRTATAPPDGASRTPTIGLALGAGGARGLAHILVLEVLDEIGLKPKLIAGTSIGALIGAAYAIGMPAYRIRAVVEETLGNRIDLVRQVFAARSDPVQRLLGFLPLRSSMLQPEILLERLAPELDKVSMSDLAIPLKIVATDLVKRQPVVIDSGPVRRAVAASIAIPLIFSPVADGERLLVDGGLVNPLPFDLVADEADITVAVDVSGAAGGSRLGARPAAIEVLVQSLQIMERTITRHKLELRKPDIHLDVDVGAFGILEFWRAEEILAAARPIKARLREELMSEIARRTTGS